MNTVLFLRYLSSILAFITIPFAFSLARFLYKERTILKNEGSKNLNTLLTIITSLFVITAFYSGALSFILAIHFDLGDTLGTETATNVFNIRNVLTNLTIFIFHFGLWLFIKKKKWI